MQTMSTKKATKKAQKYSLWMKFNGEEYKTTSNDLEEGVLSLKPEQLHTEVYITAQKGSDTSERRWSLNEARKVFNDADIRHIFCNNLLLN